jgi:hypothetical protein
MERPNLKWTRATGPDGRTSEMCFRNFNSTSSHDGKEQDVVKQQQFNSEMLEEDDELNDTLFNVVEEPSNPKLKFLCNLTLPWYKKHTFNWSSLLLDVLKFLVTYSDASLAQGVPSR